MAPPIPKRSVFTIIDSASAVLKQTIACLKPSAPAWWLDTSRGRKRACVAGSCDRLPSTWPPSELSQVVNVCSKTSPTDWNTKQATFKRRLADAEWRVSTSSSSARSNSWLQRLTFLSATDVHSRRFYSQSALSIPPPLGFDHLSAPPSLIQSERDPVSADVTSPPGDWACVGRLGANGGARKWCHQECCHQLDGGGVAWRKLD